MSKKKRVALSQLIMGEQITAKPLLHLLAGETNLIKREATC